MRIARSVLILLICTILGSTKGTKPPSVKPEETPRNFKIAFIGDQGLGVPSVKVLKLIKAEEAQAVVHLGDFDYIHNPGAWDGQINNILGADFPYFSVIGNHDLKRWKGSDGYQELIKNRFKRLGITWSGDLGVQSSFMYRGIFFVLVAPGVLGSGHATFIRDQLAKDHSIWRVTGWHKNMHLMQSGRKKDETGWEVYEEARKGGAIIATGHEHAYTRTYLLSNIVTQAVANTSANFNISKGKTFVLVSGLGGQSIRPQLRGGDWWATVYARNCLPRNNTCKPNATFGALFATFNVDGEPHKAEFYFKDIDGRVIDRFTVVSDLVPENGISEKIGISEK
ncbi:MAG TPA: metallophosphoesterase [Pyrinomonadaceae bacterium]|nr:metallophosphoesterase [Pyrinomonadaceae bacterium]